MSWNVSEGDCVELMQQMEPCSVDAVVCDPPYGLEFMGKEWDRFRIDDPGTARHRGDQAGSHGELISQLDIEDGHPARNKRGVAYGGGKRPTTSRCRTCGKKDQQRAPGRACTGACDWRTELIDPFSAPPTMLAFQNWCNGWATEALRVLKPGGHLLAFGGTRTYHRLVCAVEDAGFEIRDTIAYMYGSGFPKSHDVSKAIDRKRDDSEAILRVRAWLEQQRQRAGLTYKEIDRHLGVANSIGKWTVHPTDVRVPTWEQWMVLREFMSLPPDMDGEVWRLNGRKGQPGENWGLREKIGTSTSGDTAGMQNLGPSGIVGGEFDLTAPATPEAERWEGWGTALKPAHEPVVVARKPLSGTVAANCLEHGTGALNVDGCRVGNEDMSGEWDREWNDNTGPMGGRYQQSGRERGKQVTPGRWPANVVLSHNEECNERGTSMSRTWRGPCADCDGLGCEDGAGRECRAPKHTDRCGPTELGMGQREWGCTPDCPVRLLDEQTGELGVSAGGSRGASSSWEGGSVGAVAEPQGFGDTGGASRFFYCAKASRAERNAGLEGFEEQPVRPSGAKFGEQTMWNGENGDPEWRAKNPNNPAKNVHPTVKPISLMRWLVRLVTPPGGTVLDPFAGSGTTGIASVLEAFDFIGLEREQEYVDIARARIAWWHKHRGDGEAAEILAAGELRDSVEATGQLGMFD